MGANFLAPAPLFPLIMRDYGVDRATVSLLIASVTLMFALFTLPGGILAAKIGLSRAFTLGCFLMAAGMLVPLAPNFPALVGLRIVFGIGAAIAFPVTNALVMQWFQPRELPIVNGLNITGQSVGVAASMFLGVPLAGLLAWQLPLFLFGLVPLAGTLLWLAVARERPPQDSAGMAPPSVRDLLGILRERTALLLQLAVVGPFAMFVAFSSWLPTYYNEALGMPLAQASFIVGIIPLAGGVATVVGGVLAARLGLRRPFLIVAGAFLPFAALAAFLFDNLAVLYGGIVLLGFWGSFFTPALFTIPMEIHRTSPERAAVVTAAAVAVGDLASFASPILVGATTDATGSFLPSLTVLALLSATLLAAGALMPETGPGASAREGVALPGLT